jgi:hypothetical protein
MNYFEKCQHCVPPDRHPGCQDHCQFYKEAREAFEADKARNNKYLSLKYYTNEQKAANMDSIAKYLKRRPRRFKST